MSEKKTTKKSSRKKDEETLDASKAMKEAGEALSKLKNVEKAEEKDGVIYFHAKRPLNTKEHKQLSDKIRYEMDKTGLKIVLVPFTTDVKK